MELLCEGTRRFSTTRKISYAQPLHFQNKISPKLKHEPKRSARDVELLIFH